jgi:hypothetical protein
MPTATIQPTAEPTLQQLLADVRDARDELQYYLRHSIIRSTHEGRIQAKARAILWRATLKARVARLRAAQQP